MPQRKIPWWLSSTLVVSLIDVLAIGCAKPPNGPLCFPAHGKVLYDSKPLAEAMVVLHPVDPDPDAENDQRPIAITKADGTFELTTLQPKDGAPAGEYTITVELRDKRLDGDVEVRDGKNLLPARYRDPAQSKLMYRVVEGNNDIPTLELTSK